MNTQVREPVIVIVGFLGVGKTTLLKKIVRESLDHGQAPRVILNDYENANLDAQQFADFLDLNCVSALTGSCICCTGITELRSLVNDIPARANGVTLIEANGTTDACELMGFMAVGLNERFLPPVQVSVVDVRFWQQRGYGNELEADQIQVSSRIVLNYPDQVSAERLSEVRKQIASLNPAAVITEWQDFRLSQIEPGAAPEPQSAGRKVDHSDSHWSACSVELADPMSSMVLIQILKDLPETILRVKGCTRLDDDEGYSFFERLPSGETFVRPYRGKLIAGPRLLVIGPGSDPAELRALIERHGSVSRPGAASD